MRGNIAQLMQQAQKMQENMQRAQEELANLEVTGSAGGGMVSVTLTGAKECRKVRIDPGVLSDPEMAEDLIAAAFNDASNKIDTESRNKMGAATAGMQLPPGMKMPFRGAGIGDGRDGIRTPLQPLPLPISHPESRIPPSVPTPRTTHRSPAHPARCRPEDRAAHGLPAA